MLPHVLVVCSGLVLRRLRVACTSLRGDVLSWNGCVMTYESTITTIRSIGLTDTTLAAETSAREEKQCDQLNRRPPETWFLASSGSSRGRAVHERDALGPAVLRARPRGPCLPCILVTARPPRAPVENTCTAKKRFEESGARVPLGARRVRAHQDQTPWPCSDDIHRASAARTPLAVLRIQGEIRIMSLRGTSRDGARLSERHTAH